VKKNHIGVVPGIKEFLDEFVSESATGEYGYLSDRGLIPLTEEEHQQLLKSLANMTTVQL
jgi:phosphate transport system substrate-binding protein